MKKKLILLSSLLTFTSFGLFAQQDMLVTHFIYNKMMFNPGETGIDDGICATSVYRNQWDKVNGAPNSVLLNVEANLKRFFPSGGVGISFYHDAIGFNRQNNVLLNYSYPLELPGWGGTLGIGVGLGIVNFGMSPTWVPPQTLVDGSLPASFSATNFDMNFGLYWKSTSDYYAGISSTHLNQSLLSQTFNTVLQTYQMKRHYYLMGGKTFRGVANSNGDIDVQALVRTDFVKWSADLNARYIYNNTFYGGLTYRTIDAVALMVGWMPFQGAAIGYSFDLSTNKLSNISRGSHEILLKYCYYLPKPPLTKAKNPRWL